MSGNEASVSESSGGIKTPWALEADELLAELDVSAATGLSSEEVLTRQEKFGLNLLRETKQRSLWAILFAQLKSILVLLLVIAAAVSFIFGEYVEGVAIIVVVVINTVIGFAMELKALHSMEALKTLTDVEVTVKRDGSLHRVHAQELVPGDIVVLEGGDVVTADMRLIKASKLQANESTFTGESVPVGKHVERVPAEVNLPARSSMLFKGTSVTRGAGQAVVVSTGMSTELGGITSLVSEAKGEVTPLEKRLDKLGNRLVWITLGIASVIVFLGLRSGKETFLVIETAIALAVATVPEGLPIVATIALARGMWRMAQHNAVVERLSAVETLGSTGIILSDKTGTLTENRMTVVELILGKKPYELTDATVEDLKGDPNFATLVREVVLCNNASIGEESVGDPMEVALLELGDKAGLSRQKLDLEYPELAEEAFDPETKMMATYHQYNEQILVAVKGAPEAVIEKCTHILVDGEATPLGKEDRESWVAFNDQMAGRSLRILAVANKFASSKEEVPYQNLTLVGLVGLHDPPRKDVNDAIKQCRKAGIEIVMVTGDQALTAKNIALDVGLIDDAEHQVVLGDELNDPDFASAEKHRNLLKAHVFARTSPQQKLNLISLHQKNGSVVAMTGDGVNDAPALKKADIGVAMGLRGTQVAREASDMVLEDDHIGTIVSAVEQGRIIFANIRKFVYYLFSCNVSEVMIVGIASFANMPLPLLPLQILLLNLVTDVFPALALGVGEGDPGVMERRPRDPSERILLGKHWLGIGFFGGLITASVFAAFFIGLSHYQMDISEAVTISFLTLAFAQLWHVFNMAELDSRPLINEISRNIWVWSAILLCILILLVSVYFPPLAHVLELKEPGRVGWSLVLMFSLLPMIIGRMGHLFLGRAR